MTAKVLREHNPGAGGAACACASDAVRKTLGPMKTPLFPSKMTSHSVRAAFAVLVVAALATGCGGRGLNSDPGSGKSDATVEGVMPQNLKAKPRNSPLKLGDKVPVLLLQDQLGNMVSTREATARGDVLMIFYPGTDDPQARPVYEWVTRNRQQLANRQVEILLVNPVDPPERTAAVAEQLQLKVGILHDPSAWGSRTFGLVETSNGTNVSQVWSVIVGKGGQVLESSPGLYDFTEILTLTTMRPSPDGSFRVIDMLGEP
jgi:peroxiredoxin